MHLFGIVNILWSVYSGFCRWDRVLTIPNMDLGLLECSLYCWRKGVFCLMMVAETCVRYLGSYCSMHIIHGLQYTVLTKLINSTEKAPKIMAWWGWDMVLGIYPLESHLCLLPVSSLPFCKWALSIFRVRINSFE